MQVFDGEKFGQEIVGIVKDFFAQSVNGKFDALNKEIQALNRQVEFLKSLQPLKGDPGPPGPPGNDGINGQDGKDGQNGKDGAPGEKGERGERGDNGTSIAGPRGEKGEPGERGERGEKGESIIGPQGKDGAPGRDGMIGRDGLPGRDGKDGATIDDVTEEYDDDGRILVRVFWRGGDVVTQLRHVTTTIIDRGVWENRRYQKGDCVSENGSIWIAQIDTDKKPREADSGWRLAVKRGRDGKGV